MKTIAALAILTLSIAVAGCGVDGLGTTDSDLCQAPVQTSLCPGTNLVLCWNSDGSSRVMDCMVSVTDDGSQSSAGTPRLCVEACPAK